MRIVNPPDLESPVGFSHGVLGAAGARTLFVAGQTAAEHDGHVRTPSFTDQFDTALAKVVRVVRAAGGEPSNIARMTIYVTDMDAYRASRPQLRDVWQRHMRDHYPAMALLEVRRLVDRGAVVEIQADAVLP
jgi:enamine deaminase RidA (YjgF/YER057c/UK114 family)